MKSIKAQIAEITANQMLNARQKTIAIIELDSSSSRPGVIKLREIQVKKLAQVNKIRRKVWNKSNTYKTPEQRLRCRTLSEAANQCRHQALMDDAENGYPIFLFGAKIKRTIETIELGHANQYIKIGAWIIVSTETIHYDNDCYSKAYHSRYGGKRVVESREVCVKRFMNGEIEARSTKVSSWRGNVILDALIELEIIAPVKVQKALRSVQLNSVYDIKLIAQKGSISFYERTLAGDHVDFCAVKDRVTYHAGSKLDALKGLSCKLRAKVTAINSLITYELCKRLGFCNAGIQQFCIDFDLSVGGSYTAEYLHSLVMQSPELAQKYAQELKTLAKLVGYKI